jgi:lipoyl(octanoyl) transferase
MEASCRDLGLMDYKTCWELQQRLFDALVTRKAACKGATKQAAAPPAAYDGTAEANKASARELAQARPGTGGTQPGKGSEPPTGGVSAAEGAEPSGATGESSASAGTILLVEHPPVYTLGKSGHAENLLIGREALEAMGAQFFHIDRGGDITFHGPGQLVCYPILDLERLGIGLRDYIGALEEAVIRTVAVYGITAGRMAGASGVWIGPGIGGETRSRTTGCRGDNGGNCNIGGKSDGGKSGDSKSGDSGENRNEAGICDSGRTCDSEIGVGNRASARVPRKICAIGVRSSRYITMHGFALNVTTDLGWFTRINPCGFTDRGVTSIERETGRKAAMGEVKELVVKFLSEILNVRIYK